MTEPVSTPPTLTEADQALAPSETIPASTLVVALAALVGLLVGLLAVVFVQAIHAVHAFSHGPLLDSVSFLQPYVVVLLPALGGLLVGLVAWIAPEVRGMGVPAVMAAATHSPRALRPIAVLAKPLAAALTLGTGGSAGQEGPVVHGGAALADMLATALTPSPAHRRALLASASAGAIAAVFDAPLAGLAFSLEVILGGFSASSIGNVGTMGALLVASIGAVAMRRAVLGVTPPLTVSGHPLTSPSDLVFLAALGVVAGALAVFFSWLLQVAEDVFLGWQLPGFMRPAAGGLAVGIMAFLIPLEGAQSPLLGPGLTTLEAISRGEMLWLALLGLVVLKSTTTAITVGSGGSGDVFGPALVVGGALGGAWGELARLQFPGLVGPTSGYVLAGMVAVLSGVIHAPITAILLGYELTGDVRVLPALVIAGLAARWIAGQIDPLSAYTARLNRPRLRLRAGRDEEVLNTLTLADVLENPGPASQSQLDDPSLSTAPVAVSSHTLSQALHTLGQSRVDQLLVIDADLPGRLLGIVRHADIEATYRRAVEPAEPADTIESAEPADAVEPAEPADTIESAEPADAVEPTEPADTVESVEPADAVESVEPADTVESAEATGTAGPENDLLPSNQDGHTP